MNRPIPFDFFLLRTPRFSTQVLDELNKLSSQDDLNQHLLKFFENTEALQALYFANTAVYFQLIGYIKTGLHKKKGKLFLTLYKYLIRMSSRPTPFGQLAGISYGHFSLNKTSLLLTNSLHTHIRFDQELLLKFMQELSLDPSIKENISYYANTTISHQQAILSYIEYSDTAENRYFQWRKIQENPLLSNILKLTKNGIKYHDLTRSLTKLGLNENQAKGYINELITIKLLIPEFEPIVTKDHSDELIANLSAHLGKKIGFPLLHDMVHVKQSMRTPYDLEKLTAIQQNIQAAIPGHFNSTYQVDSKRNTQTNQIHTSIIEQLSEELTELTMLNKNTKSADLVAFVKKFQLKYGERKVSLMEALDPEIGIGYGMVSPLLDETVPLLEHFKINSARDHAEQFNSIMHGLLAEKSDPKTGRLHVLELTKSDLQHFQIASQEIGNKHTLGMYLLGNLLWNRETNQADGHFKFNLLKAGGASALPLMTRFDHLDHKLKEKLLKVAAYEEKQADGALLAEVVFLPNGRAGNILTRSSLYKYEIPIICQAGVEEDYTIRLEDIYITVRNETIQLISKKLNKEIIPRLSSAHNFHYGMVVYRFLCDLQKQNWGMDLQWDWGSLSAKTYLPRVTYKHFILSRARWKINQQHLASHDSTKIQESVSFLKIHYDIPDRLLLAEGDHELLLDLTNPLAAKILLQALSKHDITVVEYIYDSYPSTVQGADGEDYSNEIILPYTGGQYTSTVPLFSAQSTTITRQFPLGSEWLYVKLYGAERTLDRLLADPIHKLIARLHEKKYLKKWFFIRYYDPDPHLRIRIKLSKYGNGSLAEIIQLINQYCEPLISQKKIFNISYDTYERELERYGASNMVYCERIFHLESELILNLLPHLKKENDINLRWLIAIKVVHIFLSSFHLTVAEKIALTEKIRDQFLNEFKRYKKLRYSIDLTYRAKFNMIHDFFNNLPHKHPKISRLLDQYKNEIAELCMKSQDTPEFKAQPTAILTSLIHMFLNRIFVQKQREQEMVIYHFLSKYLISVRMKSSDRKSENYSFPESPNLL
ncbi:lantibiotic dehydratase [Sphingobacterium faecium]|uniref:lantibiotic dehydratase n=1 Tax=Sphingobacterium faecium TaxID=34087 RepID=UPI003209F0BE